MMKMMKHSEDKKNNNWSNWATFLPSFFILKNFWGNCQLPSQQKANCQLNLKNSERIKLIRDDFIMRFPIYSIISSPFCQMEVLRKVCSFFVETLMALSYFRMDKSSLVFHFLFCAVWFADLEQFWARRLMGNNFSVNWGEI